MSVAHNGRAVRDPDVYAQNRSSHSLSELAQYENQWVAWSADGTRVVAHHQDLVDVAEQVKAQGVNPEEVVLEYIPLGGEVTLL